MITIHNLIVGYKGKKLTPSITGNIESGSMIAVMGPNGIGKSMFLKTLAGLLYPASGTLKFKKKRVTISYLPQKNNIDCYFPITVFDVVSMGCWPKVNFFKRLNYKKKCLIWNVLKEVNLVDVLNHQINNLSGGQVQRMLLARVLVQQSSLILLDEPFQGIDQHTCDGLIRFINNLRQKGSTIIVVLHDHKYISKYFSNILLLDKFFSIWQ